MLPLIAPANIPAARAVSVPDLLADWLEAVTQYYDLYQQAHSLLVRAEWTRPSRLKLDSLRVIRQLMEQMSRLLKGFEAEIDAEPAKTHMVLLARHTQQLNQLNRQLASQLTVAQETPVHLRTCVGHSKRQH